MRVLPFVGLLLLSSCTDFDALTRGHSDLEVDAAVVTDLAGNDLASGGDAGVIDGGAACSDHVLSIGETDIDCGGQCAPCDVAATCLVDIDCQTGACVQAHCEVVSGPPSWVAVGTAPTDPGAAPIGRADVAVGRGPDGVLYVMGGRDRTGASLDVVEKLDVTAGWSASQSLKNKRAAAATVSTSTFLAVLYGMDTSGPQTTTEVITTSSSFTTQTGLAATLVAPGAAVGPDGRVYVFGGTDATGMPQALNQSFAAGDTALNPAAPLTNARAALASATGNDGRIYAIGGVAGGVTLGSVEAYTVAGSKWTVAASLPAPRGNAPGVLGPDGRIYVPGGANLASGQIYSSTVAYRPASATQPDAWVNAAPLAGPRWRHGAALGPDGRIYVIAGSALGELLRTVEAYGPVIAISADSQPIGSAFWVAGSNFAASATVQITIGSPTGALAGTGTTDATGVLTSTAKVPAGTPTGATRLYVVDSRSRYPVSTAITVTP